MSEAGMSAGKVGGAARIVLGLIYPRRLQKTYHAAGGGCRNRACQVRSWSSGRRLVGPGWGQRRWEIGPFAHTRASVVGVSMEPSVVGRGWSPVSSNKARGCCCRTSCQPPSPIAAEACSPAAFACKSVHREPTPGVPGSGWRRGRRRRFLCQLPL
jgi:hypothetical protein